MIKVLFMGRKPVAAQALEYLLACDDVEVVGVLTDSHLAVSPTSDIARIARLPIFEFSEALGEMKAGRLCFDFGVSMLYWRKLCDDFLTLPKLGIINFHPAPLPEYKGTAGYNLAIMDGLSDWATTAHYVDENIDTGGIVEVLRFPIDLTSETAQSLERKTQPILLDIFKRTINRVIESKNILPVMPNVGGRYISRDEMEAMKEIKPGDDISRKIRAFWFPPYDGAFLRINGIKYTLVDGFILQKLGDPNTSNLFTRKSC